MKSTLLALSVFSLSAYARPHMPDVSREVLRRLEASGARISVDEYHVTTASLLGHTPGNATKPCLLNVTVYPEGESLEAMASGPDAAGKHHNIWMELVKGKVKSYDNTPSTLVAKGVQSGLLITYDWYTLTMESDASGALTSATVTDKMNALVTGPDWLEGPSDKGTVTCEFPYEVQ